MFHVKRRIYHRRGRGNLMRNLQYPEHCFT